MSHNTPQDTAGYDPAAEATSAEPKSAARKTAKKAAKKAAKKVTAKKAAARKTVKEVDPAPAQAVLPLDIPAEAAPKAKKVARKKAATSEEQSFSLADAPAPVTAPREKAPEAAAESRPAEVSPSQHQQEAPANEQRPVAFGRVPGGGPVVNREDREPREQREQREPRGENRQQQQQPAPEAGGDRTEANRERRKRRRKRRREREREGRGGSEPQGGSRGPSDQQQQPARQVERQSERRPDRQADRQADRQVDRHNDRQVDRHNDRQAERQAPPEAAEKPGSFTGPKVEVNGMLELAPKGFGFLRVPTKNFEQARDDVFVSPEMVRRYGLRPGVWIHGLAQEGSRGQQLVELTTINDLTPDEAKKLPSFDELKAVNPGKRISLETTADRYTTRVLDLMAPVGRGQRGLIVSPPRSGKTTLLLHIAEAVRELHDETMHLMILLVDERPEEVTEFRRTLPGAEIYASSNDEGARNHCRIAEMCIERAKRLVEGGKHVFLLMDSITRLARAYNGGMRQQGRGIGTGGVTVGALEVPRRLFAAARNTREAGSLTILATALIQTNSRADEAIFLEFKGTGNMELVLDRKIAENYIYPAVDIFKSGTRREELLLPEHMLHKIHLIRRGLAGHRPVEAMERLLYFLKKFSNNPQMLLEIKG